MAFLHERRPMLEPRRDDRLERMQPDRPAVERVAYAAGARSLVPVG